MGIITLIPKGNKSRDELKNWRPISLLNVIYKLASGCIANRLKKVLSYLIQEKQKEVAAKLSDPNYTPQKEELSEHAMTLSIMLAEQKAMTEALEQSKAVMIDFLKSDGREALVAFFKIKGGL